METMKKLYETVAGDSGLQSKFSEIMEQYHKGKPEDLKEKLLAFSKEAGYAVSYEEIKNFFENLSDQKTGQLSESELDAVAGGKNSDNIKHSITSLGSFCAALSAKDAIKGDDCGSNF